MKNMSQYSSVKTITQKRLIGELKMLHKEPLELIDTYPDDKDSLLWYFLLRGPEDSEYKGGYYIGKVLHNPEYPIKAPDFMMLTPTGRFEIEKKICLTNSGYHAETWSAVWNMKTILLGFLSIMADDSTHGISHIHESKEMRKMYAEQSVAYNMSYHRNIWLKFERFVDSDGNARSHEEIKLLSAPILVKKPVVQQPPVQLPVTLPVQVPVSVPVQVPVQHVQSLPPTKPTPAVPQPVVVMEEAKPKRGRKKIVKDVDTDKATEKPKRAPGKKTDSATATKPRAKRAIVAKKARETVPQPFNQLNHLNQSNQKI